MSKNIILLGADGFIGWPTALHLSNIGYDVTIVDNFATRKINLELGTGSLTPIKSMEKRIQKWKEITDVVIDFKFIDISDHYHRLLELIKEKEPIAIAHFAEQRSAPYSQKSSFHKRYTVNNNINGTNNVLAAIVESGLDIHLVHIGTAGVYGYGTVNKEIPEGYLKVKVDTDDGEKEIEIMYPPSPGSLYHNTKCMDAMLFLYYNKNDKIRISDAHQGIVWGCQTKETKLHDDLINRWDYCGDNGTVLNRFIIQSQLEHPLTVHGTGGQTRAFINIQNSVECIQLMIENPPDNNRVRILNQSTECMNVFELANLISKKTDSEIRYYNNPRNEDDCNDLRMSNKGLLNLGLKPITLKEGLIDDIMQVAKKYKDRADIDKIVCTSTWNSERSIDTIGSDTPVKG